MPVYVSIGLFALLGLLFGAGAMILSRLLAPVAPDKGNKRAAYESGEKPFGSARIQFRIGYYLYALMFLVFDVEAIFLFPVLAGFKQAVKGGGLPGLMVWLELLVFIIILGSVLIHAWREKVLEWE